MAISPTYLESNGLFQQLVQAGLVDQYGVWQGGSLGGGGGAGISVLASEAAVVDGQVYILVSGALPDLVLELKVRVNGVNYLIAGATAE